MEQPKEELSPMEQLPSIKEEHDDPTTSSSFIDIDSSESEPQPPPYNATASFHDLSVVSFRDMNKSDPDVRFVCKDEVVVAHRFFLSANSAVLREKLRQSQESGEKDYGTINMEHYSYISVSRVINCMYTGQLVEMWLNFENKEADQNKCVAASLEIALQFQMGKVVEKMKESLKTMCTDEVKAVFLLRFLNIFACKELKDVKTFVQRKLGKLW